MARSVSDVMLYAVFASLSFAPALGAQAPGEIRGTVVNVQGAVPVAGVAVEILIREAPDRAAVTTDEGEFRVEGVPAGTHRVRIRHLGFHLLERGVEVAPGQVVRLELELTPTTLDLDTLRVFASPLTIRREDTEFTSRIDRRAIRLLPTPYDTEEMVFLTPGAAPGRIWGGRPTRPTCTRSTASARRIRGRAGPSCRSRPRGLSGSRCGGSARGPSTGTSRAGS